MQSERFYDFGEFRLDCQQRVLWRNGREVLLSPRLFEMLLVLVAQHGQIVTHDYLLQTVWQGTAVEPASIKVSISALRRALGESASTPSYIETVPRRGYRFIAPVVIVPAGNDAEPADAPSPVSETVPNIAPRFAQTASFSANARPATPSFWRRRLKWVAALVLLLSASFGLYRLRETSRAASLVFPAMRIAKLTNTGNATHATLAPDGKRVAYTLTEVTGQSLWLRQTANTEAVRLLPPLKAAFWGLSFTPDGNALYYVVEETEHDVGLLYRLPLSGGVPQKLLTHVNSEVSFSPDGRQMAFIRLSTVEGQSLLMVARSDGSDARVLAARQLPQAFWHPAWSPDGTRIACQALNVDTSGKYSTVITFLAGGGTEQQLGTQRWHKVLGLNWLPTGDGLALAAAGSATETRQLWWLSFPRGEVRRITNDLTAYHEPSSALGGRTLVAVQREMLDTLWVTPVEDVGARRVVFRAGRIMGLDWTLDGQLIYGSNASGQPELWQMDSDGGRQRQLTVAANVGLRTALSADGQTVFFSANHAGREQLWRFDRADNRLRPLTEADDYYPQPTPDGQWVIYASYGARGWQLMKAPAAGGGPIALSAEEANEPAVAPDGRWLAYRLRDPQTKQWNIGVRPLIGDAPVRVFKPAPGVMGWMRWTPDSQALTYFTNDGGQAQFWRQPLTGAPPVQVFTLQGESVYAFAWSRDGQRLAFVTHIDKHDVVLLEQR
jgi:Tol biopolymer transport system component/DNA-binding winged helix-turn-helix (wHTH) protein